jgi:Ca2+-binding RTX toxin-like protein
MASETGTNGNNVIDHFGDTGPGTLIGLAGDDCIFTGSGAWTVTGDSGLDTIVLRTGNTGSITGGSENDLIFSGSLASGNAVGALVVFGNAGADQIDFSNATGNLTIQGGDDSGDGADRIDTGAGNDLVFGNGGNDRINVSHTVTTDNNTVVGGFGDDEIFRSTSGGNDLALGNQGDDRFFVSGGNDTVVGGLGNDSIRYTDGAGSPMLFGSEGSDTINAPNATGGATIQGGLGSDDGADSLLGGTTGNDLIFGNGGADTIDGRDGLNTAVGGLGGDSILGGTGNDAFFGNEDNDTINAGDGANSVVGGQGNDCVTTGDGADVVIGSEGDDRVSARGGADTLTGGSGNDTFLYGSPTDDGNGAAGGAIETITDLDWAVDAIRVPAATIDFARNYGSAFTGQGTLASAADAAVSTALVEAGGGFIDVAAQFDYGGRTWLVAESFGPGSFTETQDLLIDITGATGTISTTRFV